jgi:GH24 family phage-related lysozyme (muramidase)
MADYNTKGITIRPKLRPTGGSFGLGSKPKSTPVTEELDSSFFDRVASWFSDSGADLPNDDSNDSESGISVYDGPAFNEAVEQSTPVSEEDALREVLNMSTSLAYTPEKAYEAEPEEDMNVVEELPEEEPKGLMSKPKGRPMAFAEAARDKQAEIKEETNVVASIANNVDFDFIKGREGFKTNMYVPKDKNGVVLGKSGATIASGFDLGQKNEADLKGLPTYIIDKLKPYLGIKGSAADTYVKNNKLKISKNEANIINTFAKEQEIGRLKKDWQNSVSSIDFDDLTKEQATVVASVAFQYGDLPKRTPKFWKYVTTGDWTKAEQELRAFGDKYKTRRTAEANYLVGK